MCVWCVCACVPAYNLTVILREVYGLTFPENRVLRNVFGPQREETTGDLRKLHSEKLKILYPSKPGLSPGFVMHKGIPIAIVRLRHKKM